MTCRRQLHYPAFGYLLQGAGWALIAFSLLVDMFYPGSPGFGSLQYAGMVVGVMLILTGLRELLLPQSTFWVRLLFSIYLLGIAVVGLTPQAYQVDEARSVLGSGDFSGADFVINISGFIPFGYLLMSCLSRRGASQVRDLTRWQAGMVLAAGMFTSLFIELCQYSVVPGRFASLLDWLANGLGTLLGILLYRVARHWDALLRVATHDPSGRR
jgi:hypothetical protein